MAVFNPQDARKLFFSTSQECNIISVFQDNKIRLSDELLEQLLSNNILSVSSLEVPANADKKGPDWDSLEEGTAGVAEYYINKEIAKLSEKERKSVKSKVKTLAQSVAADIISQLREADKCRPQGFWASVWGGSTKVHQEVYTCIQMRGTADGIAEMLKLRCKGKLQLQDGKNLSLNLNISIDCLTLNLPAVEWTQELEKGCLVRAFKWYGDRRLK